MASPSAAGAAGVSASVELPDPLSRARAALYGQAAAAAAASDVGAGVDDVAHSPLWRRAAVAAGTPETWVKALNTGAGKYVRVGYAGAAVCLYAGFKASSQWDPRYRWNGEKAPVMLWMALPAAVMGAAACARWTNGGHEARFWKFWPRTVPGVLVGLAVAHTVLGKIAPEDRTDQLALQAWAAKEAERKQIEQVVEQPLTPFDRTWALRLQSGIQGQHDNAATATADIARVHQKSVHYAASQLDNLNLSYTRSIFDARVLLSAARASPSCAPLGDAYKQCLATSGRGASACLPAYNALEKCTTDGVARLRSADSAPAVAAAWKIFSADVYTYDSAASPASVPLRSSESLTAAEEALVAVLAKPVKQTKK